MNISIKTGVALLLECDVTGAHDVRLFKSCISSLYLYSFSGFGNFTATLEQCNNVTGASVVVINALYDERMHADVLKITSRS